MLNQNNIAGITDQKLLAEFSAYEGVCRSLASQAPYRKTGHQLLIKAVSGEYCFYQVWQIVTEHPGLVGEILTPAEGNDDSKVIVSWTGTRSAHSALIDLESAPGEESYRASEHIILAQINVAIALVADRTKRPVEVVFTGYSLGGAVAQLTLNTCQRAIATNMLEFANECADHEFAHTLYQINSCFKTQILLESKTKEINDVPFNCRSHFHHVDLLSLGVSAHAGVLKAVERNSNALEPILEKAGIHHVARFMILKGDLVPKIGPGTVLTETERADVAILQGYPAEPTFKQMTQYAVTGASLGAMVGPVTATAGALVGFCAPLAKATLQAHTNYLFDETGECQFNHALLSNQHGEGSMDVKATLQKKTKLFETPGVQKGLYFLRHLPGRVQTLSQQSTEWVAKQLRDYAPQIGFRAR